MEKINEISMEGFRVVSSDFFTNMTRTQAPTLTIWDGSIGFCKSDITLLNGCENVLIHINSEARKILIVPTSSSDKDAVRWVKKSHPREGRKISCKKLTDSMFDIWKWDREYIYRTVGRLVTSGNKVMLLFDFSEPECWKRPEAKSV